MFSNPRIYDGFANIIGIKPPYDNTIPIPASWLMESKTGLWLQDLHALCSLENLYNAAPDFDRYEYPAYLIGEPYKRGQIVTSGGKKYRATQDISIAYPAPGVAGADNWQETDPWSEWLRSEIEAGISDTLSAVIREKKLTNSTKTLIDQLMLFDGIGNVNDRIIKQGRFVGFRIDIISSVGLTALIQAIGLQLDAPQPLTLYLYHTSRRAAVATLELDFSTGGGFLWAKPATIPQLTVWESSINGEGSWLLGYYEDDLEGVTQAINRTETNFTSICATCNAWNTWSFNQWSRHLRIQPISIAGATMADKQLPVVLEQNTLKYHDSTNWGMNLKIAVVCDFSQMFLDNLPLLGNAIGMRVALRFLSQIAYSYRINVIEERTKAFAMAELNPVEKDSLAFQFQNEIKTIGVDFSNMSSECMPQQTKTYMKLKAI